MTTSLATAARRNAVLFSVGDITGTAPKMSRRLYKKADNTTGSALVLSDVAVFRSGTFRDSMGFQHNWESIHMDQMVAHFDMLRARQIFSDIPVRDGHPGFLLSGIEGNGKTVGWHTGLRAEQRTNPSDGKEYTYLLAEYEVLDEDAIKKIESGLWRNRSSEIGSYITNDEAEFWPVYQGFAYVDIPAVEGLNGFAKSNPGLGTTFSLMIESEEETPVGAPTKKHSAPEGVEAEAEVEAPAAQTEPDEVVEPEVVVAEVEVHEDGTVTVTDLEDDEDEDDDEDEPAAEEVDEPQASHSKTGPVGTFRINGQSTTDFASVQQHIDALEGFAKETTDANRKAFVSGLVVDKKITGAQQATLEEFALGLSTEQYGKWCESYGLAPQLGLLSLHAAGSSNHDAGGGEPSTSEVELETAREIVASHKRAGMPMEQIEATKSFLKLKQNDPTFTL